MTDTLNRGYPYPQPTADPDVPYWLQRLAEDVDTDVHPLAQQLARLPYKVASGTSTISIGSAVASATLTVTLPAGFTATPAVTATMATATAGRASLLNIVVTNSTSTSFVVRLYTSDNANTGTSYTIGFNWIAVQQ